jgi:hypothetical protein
MISNLTSRSSSLLLRASLARSFSTTAAGGNYEAFDENIFYSPVRKVSFSNGRSTIFNNVSQSPNKLSYVPWEVKEATVKNFLGVIGMNIIDYLFHPFAPVYTIGSAFFGLNWIYRVYGFLGNSIEKIDLLEDGKTVEVTFKTGGNLTIKVKDIVKKENEKELV